MESRPRLKTPNRSPKKFNDLTGQVFNRLTVNKKFEWFEGCGKKNTRQWECECSCGKLTVVVEDKLVTGKTKSCGCLFIDAVTKHGKSNSDVYNIYHAMLHRCYNTKNVKYHLYGGNGVTVCERWLNSFENFLEDMGERPEGMSINRVHGAKVYSKETCEWATCGEQAYDLRVGKVSKSGCTGVYVTRHGTYSARISYKGKIILLGTYKTFEEAKNIRLIAEIEYYGYNKPI